MLIGSSLVLCTLLASCSSSSSPSTASAVQSTTIDTEKTEASVGNHPRQINSSFESSILSNLVVVDSVDEQPVIRASQPTDRGTLIMTSSGPEERGHLNVSSNYGVEGDPTFQSNYLIIYKTFEEEKIIAELSGLLYVQPTEQQLSFKRIDLPEAELYMLTPQYTTGHGLEGYVFAVNKNNDKAFPVNILKNGHIFNTLVYSEISPPVVNNNTLIVSPPIGAGGSPDPDTHYTLNLDKQTLEAL